MKRHLTRLWIRLLVSLLAVVVLAGVTGVASGHFWPALSLGLAAVLGYTWLRLYRLHVQLLSRKPVRRDTSNSIWIDLQQLANRRGNQGRQRQRRLLGLVYAFREAADALPDAVVQLSRDQHVVWFNRAAIQLLGLQQARDTGSEISHVLPIPTINEWLRAGAADPLLDVASPGDGTRRLNFRLVRYGSAGEQLLIVRDATQIMHLEQMRRDFVANVSHELRTPLTVLHGYLDLLDPEDAPQLAPMLDEMRAQSTRMTRLVEDLLTLSRLETGSPLQDERVRMPALIQTLLREAQALSQGTHAIEVQIDHDTDLLGSTKELHSAFSNLVSNAVRYTPAGGRIVILWTPTDDGAALSVTDSGNGIAAQHLARITERFYRVSNSRSRETGGTGLGLSIVKHVLQLHQARLEITSEVGVGSTFACHFTQARLLAPIAGPAVQTAPIQSPAEHPEP